MFNHWLEYPRLSCLLAFITIEPAATINIFPSETLDHYRYRGISVIWEQQNIMTCCVTDIKWDHAIITNINLRQLTGRLHQYLIY